MFVVEGVFLVPASRAVNARSDVMAMKCVVAAALAPLCVSTAM